MCLWCTKRGRRDSCPRAPSPSGVATPHIMYMRLTPLYCVVLLRDVCSLHCILCKFDSIVISLPVFTGLSCRSVKTNKSVSAVSTQVLSPPLAASASCPSSTYSLYTISPSLSIQIVLIPIPTLIHDPFHYIQSLYFVLGSTQYH